MRTFLALSWLFVSLFVLVSVSFSADSEVDILLNLLVEKKVINQDDAAAIRAEAAIQTQEEIAKKKKFGLEGKTRFDVSGYLQTQYVADESSGKFDESKIRRARLDLRGNVRHDIGWRLQVDAVQPLKGVVETMTQKKDTTKSVTAKTTKVVTRPILLDTYLDYKLNSFVSLRVGQFKLPFGRENLESSPNLDTINRSQVTEKLVPGRDIGSQGRDIGGLVSGVYNFGAPKKIEYAVGVFNGSGINVGEDNDNKDLAGRVLVFPTQGLSAGVAHYHGKSGAAKADKIRTGGELNYATGNLSLKTEYIFGKDGSINKYGWYAQAGYKVVPEVETVVKYDSYDPDTDKTSDRTDVTTFGVNWLINKWAKIQANYEWKIEEGTKVENNTFLTQFQTQF